MLRCTLNKHKEDFLMSEYECVDSVETLTKTLERVKNAQKKFSKYSQEQVDKIFQAAAIAANEARIPLAKMAVEETGMGIVEDKVIKNHYAAEYIYNKYKNEKTCGVIYQDESYGIKKSQYLLQWMKRMFVWGMHFANYRRSLFQTIWYHLSRSISA